MVWCVGRVIAEGYRCIRVFSVMDSPVAKLVQEGTVLEFDATFQLDDRWVCGVAHHMKYVGVPPAGWQAPSVE